MLSNSLKHKMGTYFLFIFFLFLAFFFTVSAGRSAARARRRAAPAAIRAGAGRFAEQLRQPQGELRAHVCRHIGALASGFLLDVVDIPVCRIVRKALIEPRKNIRRIIHAEILRFVQIFEFAGKKTLPAASAKIALHGARKRGGEIIKNLDGGIVAARDVIRIYITFDAGAGFRARARIIAADFGAEAARQIVQFGFGQLAQQGQLFGPTERPNKRILAELQTVIQRALPHHPVLKTNGGAGHTCSRMTEIA